MYGLLKYIFFFYLSHDNMGFPNDVSSSLLFLKIAQTWKICENLEIPFEIK